MKTFSSYFKTTNQTKNLKCPQNGKQVNKILANGKVSRYHVLKSQAHPLAITLDNPTILWQCQIQPTSDKVRKRMLVFKQVQYIISDWTGDKFPSCIYIRAQNMKGFIDYLGNITDRVAVLQLQDFSGIIDQSGVKTYDIRYAIRNPVNWQIPENLIILSIRLSIDNQTNYIVLPLPNPITLNFQIRIE